MDGDVAESAGQEKNPVLKRAVDLSRLVHLFYRSSAVLNLPSGKKWLDSLASLHPEIARAAAKNAAGEGADAGNIVLDLLLGLGVDFEAVAAEEGRSGELEDALKASPNWYARAKADAGASTTPASAPNPPCLDGTKPLHPHGVWLGQYPHQNDFPEGRDWLLNKEYGGKPAAWWLANCVTGLPFRVEPFQFRVPGVYSIKPSTGGGSIRLLCTRRGGKVIIIWWGTHQSYNGITSYERVSNLPTVPVERIL